ncbi:hypothetical protein F5Y08DRAFT_343155 [Xylaria arbuscula]|nr:hypothetical protein F5Y08DRAFT_343155 [Xylaria arbuscula]
MDNTRESYGYNTRHDSATNGSSQTQGRGDGLHATLNLWTGSYVAPDLCEQPNYRTYRPSIPSARALFPDEFQSTTTRGSQNPPLDTRDQVSTSAGTLPTIPPLNELLGSVTKAKNGSDLTANTASRQGVPGSSSSGGTAARLRRMSVSEKWNCPHCGYKEAHISSPRSQCALCDRCGTVWIMDEYREIDGRNPIF